MHSCLAGRAQTLGSSGLSCLREPLVTDSYLLGEGQVSSGVADLGCDLFKVLPAWRGAGIYLMMNEWMSP